MTGAVLPRWNRAPHDYCYALDAARAMLGNTQSVAVVTGNPLLRSEASQRFPEVSASEPAASVVWIEPQPGDLQPGSSALQCIHRAEQMVIIWKSPLAGITRPGRALKLRRRLRGMGFRIERRYGIHSLASVGLFRFGALLDAAGRPDIGDLMRHRAQALYQVSGVLAPLSTVQLVVATRSTR